MSLLKSLYASLITSLALLNLAQATPCTDFELLVNADAAALKVMQVAEAMPRSSLQTRILREIGAERTRLNALADALGTPGAKAVNPGEVARLSERLRAWEEVAAAPPPRLAPSTHHDPTSPDFRGGGSMTTVLPADATSAFAGAIPEAGSGGLTWWAKVGDVYYRYQGSVIGGETVLHWNGMTQGARAIRFQDVPNTVRRALSGT